MLAWLVCAYFILCLILRIIRSDSLQNDEAEQALFSQMLLLGYGRQPPLYDWLQIGLNSVLGLSLFSLSLLKNAILCLCCLTYAWAARQVISDRHIPYLAMIGLLAVPSITLLSQRDLTHAVSTLLFVSLFLLFFLRVLRKGDLASYCLLGMVVGLGALTKYNFVLIPLAALGAMVVDTQWRARVFNWRILAAALIAGLIVLPHGLWVFYHFHEATSATIEAMREGASSDPLRNFVRGLFSMVIAFLKGTLPVVLIFAVVFYRRVGEIWPASDSWTRLMGWMIVFSLLLVAMIGLGFEASNIRQKWLSPFQMLLPLYLALKLAAARIDCREGLAQIAPPLLALVMISAIGLAAANIIGPYFGHYSKEHTPYRAMLQTAISQHGGVPAYIITDDVMMAGNSRINYQDTPVLTPEFQPNPLNELLPRGDGLVVWPVRENSKDGIPVDVINMLVAAGLPVEAITLSHLDVPYNFAQTDETMRFFYFWLKRPQ